MGQLGVKMTDGFKVIVIGIVYALPTILISLIFTVPSTIMSASSSQVCRQPARCLACSAAV